MDTRVIVYLFLLFILFFIYYLVSLPLVKLLKIQFALAPCHTAIIFFARVVEVFTKLSKISTTDSSRNSNHSPILRKSFK